MILVDTSVWVDHFRTPNLTLTRSIRNKQVRLHPLVYCELSMGNLPRRETTLLLLRSQAKPPLIDMTAATDFVEAERLYGLGVGFIHVNLVASLRRCPAQLYGLAIDACVRFWSGSRWRTRTPYHDG